ncbi:MAG: hypothetical protein ACLU62_05940 [Hydrogeniiclostridium sp.]
MKLLLFLCSPNSIGKTTIARGNPEEVSHSAYVDSDACRKINPFCAQRRHHSHHSAYYQFSASQLSGMPPGGNRSLFAYGFHGRRWERLSW